MTLYNEEQALANHTASHNKISKLVEVIGRREKRIADQARMIEWLQNRNADLERAASPIGQAEKVFE